MNSEPKTNGRATRQPRTSRLFRVFLYSLAAAALFLAALVSLLSTPWFRGVLERQVASRLENLTGGRVEIGAMRFNPVILQITLQGLTIHGAESPSEPPLFAARTVVARLSLVPLARRKIRLRTLDWENAALHFLTRPDGSTNIPSPPESGSAGQAVDEFIDLSIGRITLSRTQIEWNDQRWPLDLEANSVALLLRNAGSHRYTGNFSSTATRVRAAGWSLPPVTLTSQFELTRSGLKIKSFAWQSNGFAGQSSFSLRHPAAPEGSFSIGLAASLPELVKRLGGEEVRGGALNLQAEGNYGRGEVTARGRVQTRKLLLQSSRFSSGPVDFSADYMADRRHVELANLQVSALEGSARGRGTISFGEAPLDIVLSTQIRGLHMAAAFRSFPGAQPVLSRLRHDATIDGSADIAWSARSDNLQSRFDLRFHPPGDRIPGSTPLTGHARGQAAIGRDFVLDLSDGQFQTPHSALSAQGKVDGPRSKLAFRFVTSDFQEWRALADYLYGVAQPIPLTLESPATFSGTFAGGRARPEIRGRVEMGQFTYAGWRWDTLTANLDVAPDFIEISSGRLRQGKSELALSSSAKLVDWMLRPNSFVRLMAAARSTPLEGLDAALRLPLAVGGLATGRLELEGTPSDLAGSGALQVEACSFAREAFDSLSADVHVSSSVWSLERVQLKKGSGRLTGVLRYDPAGRSISTELQGSDFSLADFAHVSSSRPRFLPADWLDGRAGFDLQAQGTPEALRLHSALRVADLHVLGDAVGDFHGQIEGQGGKIQFEGASQGPEGRFHLSGTVESSGSWPLDLKVEGEDFRADPWFRRLVNKNLDATAVTSGSFNITGPLKETEHLEARGQVQNLEFKFPTLSWKIERPFTFRYAQGDLAASPFRLHGPSTDLAMEGSLRMGDPPTLALTAQGQAEAVLLNLLDPALQATGRSEIKLSVNTRLEAEHPIQPLVTGTLDIHDVSLRYAGFPFRVTGLNGRIRLEGARATVDSLRGAMGGGTVVLSGFATFSETPRYDLSAELDQVRLPYPSDFTSLLNGKLHLVGSSERGLLGGEITLRQVFVSDKFDLLPRLLAGGGANERRLTGLASPLAPKIGLNVQLNSVPALRIGTRAWQSLVNFDMSLQGTLANPVAVGVIHFQSGEAFFRGNRYKLAHGEVRMANLSRTLPVLDLEASTRVQRYELTINISGPLDHLKLSYRSDPPLPTEDVLSLLALGFSQKETQMSTIAGSSLPTAQAGALLSQALSNQVSGRVQRLFGISRIRVDPNVAGTGSTGGARVTFEQQVTRDLTLTYVTNTATSQYRVIQFEWAVNESSSLVGVRDQNGIFGVELKFRKRFH